MSKALSTEDLNALEEARDLKLRHGAAIMPETIGDVSRFRKLARRGLLDVIPQCRHMDTGREGEGYEITDAGEMVLINRFKETP